MKKTYNLCELDCAHCAAKMESEISKINGVINANINFIAQKLTIEADDAIFDEVLEKAQAIIKKIEPDCHIEL